MLDLTRKCPGRDSASQHCTQQSGKPRAATRQAENERHARDHGESLARDFRSPPRFFFSLTEDTARVCSSWNQQTPAASGANLALSFKRRRSRTDKAQEGATRNASASLTSRRRAAKQRAERERDYYFPSAGLSESLFQVQPSTPSRPCSSSRGKVHARARSTLRARTIEVWTRGRSRFHACAYALK